MTLERLPTFPLDAYPAQRYPRIRGVARSSPDKRGWGEPCRGGIQTKLSIVGPRGQTFGPRLHPQIASLAEFLLNATLSLGYDLRKATEPDGGVGSYVCRDIRQNPGAQSWHSWCVALDINTKGNPRRDTWRSTQPPWMVELWESAGWLWGGRFRNPYDPHHWEYLFRPQDVAGDLERAKVTAAAIHERLFPKPEEPDVNPEQVKAVQTALNALGWTPPLVVDGQYGPKTQAAVEGIANHVRVRNEEAKTSLATLSTSVAEALPMLEAAQHGIERARQRLGG